MGKMKGGLFSLVLGGAIALGAANARAGLEFPSTGVWSEPRIYSYDGSKETLISDYSGLDLGTYRFKTQVVNKGEEVASSGLVGEVMGPEYLSNTWAEFNVNPGSSSTRYWTDTITKPGNYVVRFSLDDGSFIDRGFNVIPEPATLVLLGLGAIALKKREDKPAK